MARDNLLSAATRMARDFNLFELAPAPRLETLDVALLEAHIGLYDRVAQSVFVYGRRNQSAREHKKNGFDFTVGPDLVFLLKQTGASPR